MGCTHQGVTLTHTLTLTLTLTPHPNPNPNPNPPRRGQRRRPRVGPRSRGRAARTAGARATEPAAGGAELARAEARAFRRAARRGAEARVKGHGAPRRQTRGAVGGAGATRLRPSCSRSIEHYSTAILLVRYIFVFCKNSYCCPRDVRRYTQRCTCFEVRWLLITPFR